MKKLKTYKLQVDFMFLLSDKKYKDLAVRIGKNDEHQWLNGAVARFLHANGMNSEELETLKEKVSVCFINKESLLPLRIFMEKKPRWTITANKERPLTEHGGGSFSLVICEVVKTHKKKRSYKGLLKEDDILLGEHFCWIYCKQLQDEPDASYVADFKSIWTVMAPFYTRDGKTYPQNFSVLYDTLHLKHISHYEVRTPWFNEFIMFTPSLAPSDAKRGFLVELRRSVIEAESQLEEFLTRVPFGPWQKWGRSESSESEDNNWTVGIKNSSSPVLSGVFLYDPDKPKTTEIKQTANQNQQRSTQGKTITKGSQTVASKGRKVQLATNQRGVPTTTNNQPSTSREVGSQRYTNTVWSMLNYDRCVVEHGAGHAGGVVVVENEKSMEIHASEKLPYILAYLMFTMLRDNLVKKPWLAHVWDTYKKLCRRKAD
ncbi:hypothetical protein ACQJBY_043265 [Aegilops geniculata]